MSRVGQTGRYGNTKVELDGIVFDSKAEMRRFAYLRLLERGGEIRNLTAHPSWEISGRVRLDGRWRAARHYTADNSYEQRDAAGNWVLVVEDVKNPASATKDTFTLKRHIMRERHGIEVRCVQVGKNGEEIG